MAFDSDIRNKLARMVADARSLLKREFTEQLQEIYGIQPDGKMIALEKLTHLDDAQRDAARTLRERVEYLASSMSTEKKPLESAVDRMTREQSFTMLNRFAPLRMCEERGLLQQCVGGGMNSKGFQVYLRIAGSSLGGQYERYRTFILCVFDEIAVDLGILFDRFSPFGLLFPRETALIQLMEIINRRELSHIWVEDETIGWIYQYFNSSEERKAMRKASAAPRNSRELAVRNQFFTPRYVVEFLTDNTLGRIWYEMRKGDTTLKEECRYLVRRPNEVFLLQGEKAPHPEEKDAVLSQEELLKKLVHIEHRPKKDPRDLRVLDPACGSGHFLLYAFDLLETIYEEAWQDPEGPMSEVTGRTLREDFETVDNLRQSVPNLIIEHNLLGIDIDSRAVQIAALALWLRAQKTWKGLGLNAEERPRIDRANIVTAEPMPGDEDMRREFAAGLKPRVLGQLVEVVFDKMKLAGEAGSLLKIEEEIKGAISTAREQCEATPKPEQAGLFPDLERPKPKQQEIRFDVSGIDDVRFWEQAEDSILEALKEYAERMENGRAIRRRLFAEDAARGFAFIDLCRKRYDVVLMNPPFGEFPLKALDYLSSYSGHSNNMLCPFVSRADAMKELGGHIGAIIDKTAAIKSSYSNFRMQFLSGSSVIKSYADLGWEVLDGAQVETVLISLSSPNDHVGVFIKALDGQHRLEEVIDQTPSGIPHKDLFLRELTAFSQIPNQSIAYDLQEDLWGLFCSRYHFEPDVGAVRQGLGISDSWRWYRLRSEAPPALIGNEYCVLANGGGFSPFYRDLDLLIYWAHDGAHIKATEGEIYGSWSRTVKNVSFYFRKGISYPKRTDFLNAHLLPEKCIFTVEGLGFFPDGDNEPIWISIGLMNSRLHQYLINSFCGQHKHVGYVKKLPAQPESTDTALQKQKIGKCARKGFHEKRVWSSIMTTGVFFAIPAILSGFIEKQKASTKSLKEILEAIELARQRACDNLEEIQKELDSGVFELYGVGETVKQLVIRNTHTRPDLTPLQGILEDGDKDGGIWVSDLLDACVGYLLGRWDARIAFDPSLAPKLPAPFDPLPVCPPGMLVGSDGLPAESDRIVSEEWLRARPDGNTLPPEGAVNNPTITDSEYPLRISWNGILVDDPGGIDGWLPEGTPQPHRDDIVRWVREVLDFLWKDKAHEIEQEACDILGVSDLRDYFRRPSGLFQDHLKRYSKSRRKAPIYWPLSTDSDNYKLWIYYHCLTDQTLYTCLTDFIEPKIKEVSGDIDRLQKELADGGNAKLRGQLETLMDFHQELIDFSTELLRVAKLPYKPNLNDGVMITAAPLWKLFRFKPWQKDLKSCWEKLKAGEYDWAHIAYSIWPDRVLEKCKTDRSIAIAHDLEELCEVEPNKPKRRNERTSNAI